MLIDLILSRGILNNIKTISKILPVTQKKVIIPK
jgi:hypothetical protein